MFKANGFKPTIVVCINDILVADRQCGSHCRLEDMARGCWPVGCSPRAAKCGWLIAVEKKKLIGIWEILHDERGIKWHRPTPAFFKLRPPSFDPVNMLLNDGLRHLRYVCEVASIKEEKRGMALPSALPAGFRLYGQIGYINA